MYRKQQGVRPIDRRKHFLKLSYPCLPRFEGGKTLYDRRALSESFVLPKHIFNLLVDVMQTC